MMKTWQALISLLIPFGVVGMQFTEFVLEARTVFGFFCLLLAIGNVCQLWWMLRCLNHQKLLNAFDRYALRHLQSPAERNPAKASASSRDLNESFARLSTKEIR